MIFLLASLAFAIWISTWFAKNTFAKHFQQASVTNDTLPSAKRYILYSTLMAFSIFFVTYLTFFRKVKEEFVVYTFIIFLFHGLSILILPNLINKFIADSRDNKYSKEMLLINVTSNITIMNTLAYVFLYLVAEVVSKFNDIKLF